MMSSRDFLEELNEPHPLLGDGGMGSQLIAAGLPAGQCGDLWNLENPAAVLAVQKRYVAAGSDLILTNTFGSTYGRLVHHSAGDLVEQVNAAGARIAREAIGHHGFVFGDIGPYGGFLDPVGDDEPDDVREIFEAQVRGLLTGNLIDGFMIETMAALDEIECAVKAIRVYSDLPIIISMAFEKTHVGGLKTMMGVSPEKLAQFAGDSDVCAVGANCGTDLHMDDYVAIVSAMLAAGNMPVMIQPNAGAPEVCGTTVIYHDTPEKMAQSADRLLDAGAKILGGCCGTTPEHIAAFRRLIDVRH